MFERYHIPIGLINASVGGSPVEVWLSEDVLKRFPNYQEIGSKFKDNYFINGIMKEDDRIGPLNGVAWFRKEIHISSEMAGKPARLLLGRILDSNTVYIIF